MSFTSILSDHSIVGDILYEVNKLNPIALVANGISGYVSGQDTYGVSMSKVDATVSILSAIPITKVAKVFSASTSLGFTVTKRSVQGFKSLGAAGKGFSKVLQRGGQSIKNSTWKSLNINSIKGGEAIHRLKKANNLNADFPGTIMGNGDYVDPQTGEVIDNIYDYIH